jgi:hypothetical protein
MNTSVEGQEKAYSMYGILFDPKTAHEFNLDACVKHLIYPAHYCNGKLMVATSRAKEILEKEHLKLNQYTGKLIEFIPVTKTILDEIFERRGWEKVSKE